LQVKTICGDELWLSARGAAGVTAKTAAAATLAFSTQSFWITLVLIRTQGVLFPCWSL